MKTTSFLTLACSLMLALAQGQNEPNSLSALKITDGYLVGGFTFSKLPTATLQDFRRMAPGSALLNNDLSDYERAYL
ncbi:MAG: hypothetical protein U5L96_06240 [Owenweeksia sp.]|nr:hypothetical protein [Owenweeksia sp.]